MKKTLILLAAAAVLITGVVVAGEEGMTGEKPWFDMEHCAMCKPYMAREGLMQNMAFEHHNISNGMIGLTTVKPKFLDGYRAASAECMVTANKLEAGEELPLCGMCMAFGGLMAKGAVPEMVDTESGSVTLLTAADPAVVEEIHAWVDRTADEMAKMMAAEHAEHQ